MVLRGAAVTVLVLWLATVNEVVAEPGGRQSDVHRFLVAGTATWLGASFSAKLESFELWVRKEANGPLDAGQRAVIEFSDMVQTVFAFNAANQWGRVLVGLLPTLKMEPSPLVLIANICIAFVVVIAAVGWFVLAG